MEFGQLLKLIMLLLHRYSGEQTFPHVYCGGYLNICPAHALSRGVAKVEGEAEATSTINENVVCTVRSSNWLEELRLDPEFAPVTAAVENQVDQEDHAEHFSAKRRIVKSYGKPKTIQTRS
ncbi:hypothetical protein Aduo_012695 [Ancylostoma duodenale]